MSKKYCVRFSTLLSIICLSSIVYGQQQETETDSEPDIQAEDRIIEEITVQGERTIFSLRAQIETAETQVYNLFNELNSNDEFDVTCEKTVYIGSRIPRRVCMAAYLREEEAYQTQNFVNSIGLGEGLGAPGSGMLLNLDSAKDEVRQKSEAMEQEMLRLATEVPEFAEALLKLVGLVGALERRKNE
tara:strand:- start:988 stop:1548 length:561 start_codon:yes stop_codon:yes gene_type:complete